MGGVVRMGDNSTSDPCGAPPRPPTSSSPNVYANGKSTVRVGDSWALHSCPRSHPHGAVSSGGSSSVFVNGKPMVRQGDPISCGSSANQCSSNVFSG